MLLIPLDSFMKGSKPAIDLVYISHKVYLWYTLVLNWSHQILLVFYRLFRQLVEIKTDLFKIKFYLVITVLNLKDRLFQAWERIILLYFKIIEQPVKHISSILDIASSRVSMRLHTLILPCTNCLPQLFIKCVKLLLNNLLVWFFQILSKLCLVLKQYLI